MKALGWLMVIGLIAWGVISAQSNSVGSNGGKTAAVAFTEPPQALPLSGPMGIENPGVAPLTITTRNDGYNYFVKVAHPGTTQSVSEFFIRSGESVVTQVPLGTYELKYASGKTWYGPVHMFGPETSYSKADTQFDFVDNGYQVSGYTVELYTQANGNLRMSGISANQF
ncbi:MAG: hypothetical protein GZ085_00475 [Sulfuriferula multivorans]|uniref:Uncharacterized protein n=1 Tax=Sulfuriferula multivorans TaxID=1559896 RepID=A0A7C9P2C2_9PROT|nr:hypothetical protein [Sulfuriferula multivorans]